MFAIHAVTRSMPNPCESSKPQVVEGVEVDKDLTERRPLQMRSNGVTKRKRLGGGGAMADDTESLSDIDDSEVDGYLNSEEETHYKTIIWEKINHQFALAQTQAKKQKKETEAKKDKSGKGTSENTKIVENKIQSSKINYEALMRLNYELNQDLGDAEIVEDSRSVSHKNNGTDAEGIRVGESEDTYSDELQEENQTGEDDFALRDSNYELYDEYEDGYFNNDYEIF